jgi:hypothetical protein
LRNNKDVLRLTTFFLRSLFIIQIFNDIPYIS